MPVGRGALRLWLAAWATGGDADSPPPWSCVYWISAWLTRYLRYISKRGRQETSPSMERGMAGARCGPEGRSGLDKSQDVAKAQGPERMEWRSVRGDKALRISASEMLESRRLRWVRRSAGAFKSWRTRLIGLRWAAMDEHHAAVPYNKRDVTGALRVARH